MLPHETEVTYHVLRKSEAKSYNMPLLFLGFLQGQLLSGGQIQAVPSSLNTKPARLRQTLQPAFRHLLQGPSSTLSGCGSAALPL